MTNDKLVVIGNGPSLKGFDFKNFYGLKTLGMNAAYRYWQRINWYPSYYCCLDDRTLATHHQQIYELLMREKVERIFVTYKFLDFYPKLANHERVDVLDSFVSHRYRLRQEQYGFPRKQANSFLTDYPQKLTTGSYSVRYGIYLGYRQILLLGIDCRYVPVVTGARVVDDLKMVMDETPNTNQNYFFDDYQQAGDVFQIPNPEVHQGNLHLQSFEALREDLANYTPDVEVINCNRQSELYIYDVFPYQTFIGAASGNKLGAVVVPTIKSELNRILANFKLWNHSAYLPCVHPPERTSVNLHFVFNGLPDEDIEAQIIDAYHQAESVAKCFHAIKFSYCQLTGLDDLYCRSYKGKVGDWGYKSGPNKQFFQIIDRFTDDYPYIFVMESDCFPLKANWLQRAIAITNSPEKFWVKGSIYRGNSPIAEFQQNHINGNAFYATGDRDFRRFVREIWQPFVLENTKNIDPKLSYDCAIARYFNRAKSAENNLEWLHWQNYAHLFTYTNFIQNHGGTKEAQGEAEITLQQIVKYSPDTYIVHAPHFAEPIAVNLDSSHHKELEFENIYLQGNVTQVQDNLFELTGNFANNYVAYLFKEKIAAGSHLKGSLKVILSQPVELVVSLNRHGEKKFEGNSVKYTLPAGEHKISVDYCFKQSHFGCRIQLGIEADDTQIIHSQFPSVIFKNTI
ncbi:MAG: hypothetical protein ACFCU5_01425 [Pleurocapsa sp.]